jgi:hypothetical protein
VNITTILSLIAARENAASTAAARLREQIAQLTANLAQLDRELQELTITRKTLRTIAAAEFIAEDPIIASAPYQQILAILATTTTGMRAKDICLELDIEPIPKHVEEARRKLKRMVTLGVLTETKPGILALAPKRT